MPDRAPADPLVGPRGSAAERLLRRLEWTVLRRLDGQLQGEYRTLFFGHGLELADIREYEPGDDVRYIDWNVTARMDTPFVRQYQEDREVTAWFLVDLSPSVDFGTARALKRDVVVELVAVLARLLTRRGNKVGAILYGRGVERVLRPRTGRPQVLRIVDELMRRPRLKNVPLTALGDLIEAALRSMKRRSLVFVLSDFISAPGWERPLGTLARRHEVIAVRLTDPRETEIPEIGIVVMQDAETGEHLYVDTSDARFQRRFGDAVESRERALASTFRQTAVDGMRLSTEDDLVRAIVRFALARRMRRGRDRVTATGRAG